MFSVAIDGPSGAGKSTIAKAVAKKFGFIYVDTGALYRALGCTADENNVDISDETALREFLNSTKVELAYKDGTQLVLVNGEDVSHKIRTPKASTLASNISKIPMVRDFLLDLQRNMAKTQNVIMDGRDIGTVVLPNAEVKIFLTASVEKRAMRRYKELLEKGQDVTYNSTLEDAIKRDYQDTHRETAPLKPAEDSVYIDTSDLSFDESVEKIIEVIEAKL